jgi:coenzyme PQQ precursor peptide PqqA
MGRRLRADPWYRPRSALCTELSHPQGSLDLKSVQRTREHLMQWNSPKIVEIACGCEINAYFPADL